jgi:hypothetical protein
MRKINPQVITDLRVFVFVEKILLSVSPSGRYESQYKSMKVGFLFS